MRKYLVCLGSLLLACALPAGCGRTDAPPKMTSKEAGAFDSAPAELKQTWESGLKADKANDYFAAGKAYFYLLGKELPPAQHEAVRVAIAAMNQRMYSAAAQGDVSAERAIQTFQTGRAGTQSLH